MQTKTKQGSKYRLGSFIQNLTLFILVRHTSKLNYRIIIVNTV
jgi:hypothetical protein